jgi:hypothetical protein
MSGGDKNIPRLAANSFLFNNLAQTSAKIKNPPPNLS